MRRPLTDDVMAVLEEIRHRFRLSGLELGGHALRKEAVEEVAQVEFEDGRFKNLRSASNSIQDACGRRQGLYPISQFDSAVEEWLSGRPDRLRQAVLAKVTTEDQRQRLSAVFGITNTSPDEKKVPKTLASDGAKPASDADVLDDIVSGGDIFAQLLLISERLKSISPKQAKALVRRTIRQDTPLIKALKEAHNWRCQFPGCLAEIRKRNGCRYVEVAHIEPVARGGLSILGNLLVLCPNHHKEFDHGEREITSQTEMRLEGRLNGQPFAIYTRPTALESEHYGNTSMTT